MLVKRWKIASSLDELFAMTTAEHGDSVVFAR